MMEFKTELYRPIARFYDKTKHTNDYKTESFHHT